MDSLISARGLSAGYVGVDVIRDIDLSVASGEIVALLGPNGAGKTTLLRALAGELAISAGEIAFKGATGSPALHRLARRGLGYVAEDRSVFAKLTTRQNIALGGCRVDAVTATFPELAPLLSRRAGLLSGGEQQMLTLGRALARRTQLLMVDELSRGLAPALVGRLLTAVRTAADGGLGALVVEQHVHRVLEVADRVILLRQGEIVYAAPAAEARANLAEIEAVYLTREPAGAH